MKKTFMDSDQIRLTEIHRRAVESWRKEIRDAAEIAPREDLAYLASLGVSNQALLDYAEDFCRYGEPDAATFVRIVEIRRDFLRSTSPGTPVVSPVPEADLPRKEDQWAGTPWLPRITRKAQCFLEGTLCQEVMFGCSGDRAFLAKNGLTLPTFLELVRETRGDEKKIVRSVLGS